MATDDSDLDYDAYYFDDYSPESVRRFFSLLVQMCILDNATKVQIFEESGRIFYYFEGIEYELIPLNPEYLPHVLATLYTMLDAENRIVVALGSSSIPIKLTFDAGYIEIANPTIR